MKLKGLKKTRLRGSSKINFSTFLLFATYIFLCIRKVKVRVNPASSPTDAIYRSIVPILQESVAKRDTVKTLSLILGSAIFISFDQSKNATTVAIVNTLTGDLTKVTPGVLQDVTMSTTAVTLLRETVSVSELKRGTRTLVLENMKGLIAFSEVYKQMQLNDKIILQSSRS